VIFVEIKQENTKEKKTFDIQATYFHPKSQSMAIFNSKGISFNLEVEVVETIEEKIKIKKEILEINKDKTENFKKKIAKFLKSKQFEKSYINSLESVKQEILKIIK